MLCAALRRPLAFVPRDVQFLARLLRRPPRVRQDRDTTFQTRFAAHYLLVRNLALRRDLSPDAIARRLEYLNRALPGALAEVPSDLVEAMPINEKDRHVLIANEAPTFVSSIELLLQDKERRAALGCAARAYIAEACSWGRTVRAYEAVYDHLLAHAIPSQRFMGTSNMGLPHPAAMSKQNEIGETTRGADQRSSTSVT